MINNSRADMLGLMKMLKLTIPRLMAIHFLINVLLLLLVSEGFSHRSSAAKSILQIPLFAWPIWFFFLGQGWKRILSVSAAVVFSLVMVVGYLSKDENLLQRRRFTTSQGQVFIIQQFDFDHSKELPDQIALERPLPFGFTKTIESYHPKKNSSIGKISEAKVIDNTFVIKGEWGSYLFKHNGNQLQLVQ
ncbi:MAG: hypothetical protein H7061_12885 [Bdellovibrionaceae bacterium]|nr:hypothetical protein [Bdellovibrio sp.]